MHRSNSTQSFLLAVTAFVFALPVAGFAFSFHSGAFGSNQSSTRANDMQKIVSVYEGDRTALQLTSVPQMRTSVFRDSSADNGRENNEANSIAGLPEGLFKLTDPERIGKLEQLAGSPLTYRNLRNAFASSLSNNPDQAVSTAASALFLARTIDASPREMVKLMRTGILILAAKGPRYLSQASALVGFAVQVSGPDAHQRIVSSLRSSMIGELPEDMPGSTTYDGMYKDTQDTLSQDDPELEWENFSNTHSTDRALVDAGVLEAAGMDDMFWGEVLAMRSHYRMENELLAAMTAAEQQSNNFALIGVGTGPFGPNENPFIPNNLPPPNQNPPPQPTPSPAALPTPLPPAS